MMISSYLPDLSIVDTVNITAIEIGLYLSDETANTSSQQEQTPLCVNSHLCRAEQVGYAVVVPIICVIGMFLNLFNLVILVHHRFKESTYSYLSSLAVADLLSLLLFCVNGIGRGYYPHDFGWRMFEVYIYFPCGSSTTSASILLTVTVTIERFAFIYWPLQSRTYCKQSTARKVCLCVWIVGVIINIPRFFVLTVESDGRLGYTSFGNSNFYRYLSWTYFFVISLGSGIILLIFNSLLVIGIRKAAKRRQEMTLNVGVGKEDQSCGCSEGLMIDGGSSLTVRRSERDDSTLTRSLIAVVCVFILGETPSGFTSRGMVTALLGNNEVLGTLWYRVALLISTLLVVTQHSANFIVYCLFNKRFSRVLEEDYIKYCNKHK